MPTINCTDAAMEVALSMEKLTNEKLLSLHSVNHLYPLYVVMFNDCIPFPPKYARFCIFSLSLSWSLSPLIFHGINHGTTCSTLITCFLFYGIQKPPPPTFLFSAEIFHVIRFSSIINYEKHPNSTRDVSRLCLIKNVFLHNLNFQSKITSVLC